MHNLPTDACKCNTEMTMGMMQPHNILESSGMDMHVYLSVKICDRKHGKQHSKDDLWPL